jgi:hypothetical protein
VTTWAFSRLVGCTDERGWHSPAAGFLPGVPRPFLVADRQQQSPPARGRRIQTEGAPIRCAVELVGAEAAASERSGCRSPYGAVLRSARYCLCGRGFGRAINHI